MYSVASGYAYGFTPQTVLGAKRFIISRQDHSVGLQEGFVYHGQRYKGSRLNSLDPGVYVDINENGQSSKELIRVADIETARKDIQDAFKTSSARNRDWDRMTIIEKVLKDYFAKVR